MRRRATAIGLAAVCAAAATLALGAGATAAAAPSDRALALRFRPLLLFDARERWRPIDVDRFLAEPGHAACPAPASGAPCVPFTGVAQLTPSVAYLDLRGTREDGADATAPDLASCAKSLPTLRECDLGGRSMIYAHVVHAGRRIAIDYWWFLRYNAFTLDRHEGDWEGVVAIVNAAGTKLLEIRYAAHSDVWRYDAGVPQVVGEHAKAYVSRGDHAAYPRPCVHLCRTTDGTLPEANFGGQRAWAGNTAAGCAHRCVRLFPASTGGASASWNAWPGRWGIPRSPVFAPPPTPSAQRRFQHPFAARRSDRHHF